MADNTFTREFAQALDRDATLPSTRSEFIVPTKAQIASDSLVASTDTAPTAITSSTSTPPSAEPCTYLCGNSLGLQPRRTAERITQHLATWGGQAVQGHFKPLRDSPLPTWLQSDARAAEMMAPIVGAESPDEVAVMQTLTANLHFLMAALYRPDAKGRHKILLESRAFPSDHFAVETQIRHHGLDPASSLVTIEAPYSNSSTEDSSSIARQPPSLTTYDIQSAISAHASTTALILLPGIQYYTGAVLDIPTITAYAHSHGIPIIWDLAHAVGNIPLSLHRWDVDAAAWCSYKYLNGGPGCIGGLFVHSRVAGGGQQQQTETVPPSSSSSPTPTLNRLGGWWGNAKSSRFAMSTAEGFRPVAGAAGFQMSNPSVLDITSLCASLEVFAQAGGVPALRQKSLALTAYLEQLLLHELPAAERALFRIITPSDPAQRGAQLSLLLLQEGLLEGVMKGLFERGVVVDERKPDVVRVAPAPLYNTFEDCFNFVDAFGHALRSAAAK